MMTNGGTVQQNRQVDRMQYRVGPELLRFASLAELVDASHLKGVVRKGVQVRLLREAPLDLSKGRDW